MENKTIESNLSDQEVFNNLKEKLKKETCHSSFLEDYYHNPNYLQIIGMGEKALPYIFNDLNNKGSLLEWIVALMSITRENAMLQLCHPSKEEAKQIWIDWGVKHGYLKQSK
jgi:hypothetical protein